MQFEGASGSSHRRIDRGDFTRRAASARKRGAAASLVLGLSWVKLASLSLPSLAAFCLPSSCAMLFFAIVVAIATCLVVIRVGGRADVGACRGRVGDKGVGGHQHHERQRVQPQLYHKLFSSFLYPEILEIYIHVSRDTRDLPRIYRLFYQNYSTWYGTGLFFCFFHLSGRCCRTRIMHVLPVDLPRIKYGRTWVL